jgi:aspartate kinase
VAIIVQKYGGTSVGSISRIEAVAERIIRTRQEGHQVVVVLSAMSGETNRLLALAQQVDAVPAPRELDMLLATGEQVSIALMAMALIKRGYSAISLLAHQVGIQTTNHFGHAKITQVATERLAQALSQEQIVIVAGFQGQDIENNITTLGRGGSDTSAVAIAAALKAKECQIFTDVDGVYTADPRIEPNVTKLEAIAFEQMLTMANLGAKVLQSRSVEYAYRHQLPIRVLHSKYTNEGTLVASQEQVAELGVASRAVVAICHQANQVLFELNAKDKALLENTQHDLEKLGKAASYIQWAETADGVQLTLVLDHGNEAQLLKLIDETPEELFIQKTIKPLAIVSIVCNSGVDKNDLLEQSLSALQHDRVNIELNYSADNYISVIISESDLIKSVHALHRTFALDQPS